MAAEIGAINFLDRAPAEFGLALFGLDRFAHFVGQDESRLVLAIQIAAQLKCAMALRAVGENRDCQKIVADGRLRSAKIVPDVTEN